MGIPVVISSHGGIPVRQVTSGAPVMTVATNGFGIPIVLSNRGLPFIVQGLAPAPSWSVQPSISGTTQVGQTLTGSDGTIANGTVTLRQWLNAADNSVLGTGSTLLLTEAMEGLNIKFKVTAVGTGGSATATSAQVGPVAEAATGGTFTGLPSISGTRGGTLTGTNATFTGTDTLSGQWYLDGIATGDTDTSFTDSDTSKSVEYRNTLAISGETVSAYRGVEAAAAIYSSDFEAVTSGTPLRSVPGWTYPVPPMEVAYQDTQKIVGGAIQKTGTHPYEGYQGCYYNLGVTSGLVEVECFRPLTGENRLIFNWGSANNYFITVRPGSPMAVDGATSLAWVGGQPALGSFYKILLWQDAVNKKLHAYHNGEEFDFGAGATAGRDLASKTMNSNFRIDMNNDTFQPLNIDQIESITFRDATKIQVLKTVLEEIAGTGDYRLAARGINAASAASQFRVERADGMMVADWASTTQVSGIWTATYDLTDPALQDQDLVVKVRNVGGTVTVAASDLVQVPFYASGFAKGINNSNAGVNFRNLFARTEIRFTNLSPWGHLLQAGRPGFVDGAETYLDASVVGMGYDSVVQKYPDGFPANIMYICNGVYVEPGIYEIYYPAAMTCVLTNFTGGTLTDATILTPFSGGYGKIQITSTMPSLRFTFSGGTSGSLNLKPTGYLESDTNRSRLYAESSVVPFTTIGAIGERYLDPLSANGDNVVRMTASQIWVGGSGVGGPWSPEMVAQKANAQGLKEIWIPCSCQWLGSDFLTAYFTRLIAALDPNIKVRVEPPNETWNRRFPAVTRWGLENGINAGFWNTNGDATPITSIYAAFNVAYSPGSGALLRTFAINDYVIFENIYGAGAVLLRAKKNIVTGTADYPVLSGNQVVESAAWLPLAQDADCERAKLRYYAEWADVLWDIVDAVCVTAGYNPREKIIRQICWQEGAPPAALVDWNDLHERVDAYGFAPYHNPNLLLYPESPLTSGEKALLATDIPGFINACYTHATAGVAAKVAQFPGYKAAIDAVWTSRGYPLNAKETVAYEFGGHVQAQNNGAGPWNANMSTAFPMFRRDARYGTLTQTYTQGWKDVFHSPAYYFNSVGELPDSYNGEYGYWPLMEYNTDTTNVAYVGFGNVTDDT